MPDELITQTMTPKIKHFNVFGSFDDTLLKDFVNFHRACVDEGVVEAFIYVNSPGGSVFVFEGMQALMNSGEISYHTVNVGMACSAACLLMAQGNFRWAQPQSLFMFHDAAMVNYGKMKEITETHEIFEKQTEKAMRVFADQTNKSSKWWLDKAYGKRTSDFWFEASEAFNYGVVDCIGIPVITRNNPVHVEIPLDAETIQKTIESREKKNIKRIEEQLKSIIDDDDSEELKKSAKETVKKRSKKAKKKIKE